MKIALVGNPNCGKTSVFNALTGLNQRTGNFPGITVDKKIGKFSLAKGKKVELIDLPGTYSLHPFSTDERVVIQSLLQKSDPNYPEMVLYIADATQLEKSLLLFSQIKDLNLPVVLALNMTDIAEQQNIVINEKELAKRLKVPVIKISGRTGKGLSDLKQAIAQEATTLYSAKKEKIFYVMPTAEQQVAEKLQKVYLGYNAYQCLLIAQHYDWLPISPKEKKATQQIIEEEAFDLLDAQVQETTQRYQVLAQDVKAVVQASANKPQHSFTYKIDKLLTHNVFGLLLFFALMFLVFQSIFEFASYPMDWIDASIANINDTLKQNLPIGWFSNLLTDGIIAGIGGIVIFVPQIAILFLFITILEEIGYLARVAYLLDNIMLKFGLNGRSAIALISGGACAIPAIMSARTISNPKERLLTILVTPFISCSARIPVYTILIALVIPKQNILGALLNLQGLVFMGLYLLGIVTALIASFILSKIIATGEKSYLLLELPQYKLPSLRNIALVVWEKVRQFVWEAGKIILAISIVLWFMASYGPPQQIERVEQEAIAEAQQKQLNQVQTEDLITSKKLEVSYIGYVGKFIEPAIEPLGYDWKIGIALISSFAAREVFVGTMATVYSIGSEENEATIQQKMRAEINPNTGQARFTLAVSFSLLIFYVFAMQCMGTLAVVYRETKSWKYPLVQFFFMTGLAYVSSLLVYQILK